MIFDHVALIRDERRTGESFVAAAAVAEIVLWRALFVKVSRCKLAGTGAELLERLLRVNLRIICTLGVFLLALTIRAADVVTIRAWGVPSDLGMGPMEEAARLSLQEFRRQYPWINPVSPTGLIIPGGGKTMDMVPLMQIAGDIAPDVLYVNFRKSQTYIDMKLLYPLDRYLEALAGVRLADGPSLGLDAYIGALQAGTNWPAVVTRLPEPIWPVIRRLCPYRERCPDRQEWDLPSLAKHYHVYAFPVGPTVVACAYDRSLFAEHAQEGIEMRAPRDWEEMLAWAKLVTDPAKNEFGFWVPLQLPGWTFLTFLYSAGGHVVEEDADGNWHCVLDSEPAVEAAYFYARLRHEPVRRNGRLISHGVLQTGEDDGRQPIRYGLQCVYLGDRFLSAATDPAIGIGPVPVGPTGLRGSEFNAQMCGIFSGLRADQRRRDAAWEYIRFFDGPDARCIRTAKMVEAGLGPYVRRAVLEQCNVNGLYDSVLRQISPEMEQLYDTAFAGGVPEPYGRNCDTVYDEMRKPLGAIFNSDTIRAAIERGDAAAAKAEIRAILKRGTERINQKLLGILPPDEQRKRNTTAWITIVAVIVLFAWVLNRVIKSFVPEHEVTRGGWQFARFRKAYLIVAPALILIAMWMYWPMVRGTAIAFQDYSVLGDSRWVGAGNFAAVLFSAEFWYSLRISLVYALLFMVFGFCAPIALAVLLSEAPRGKVLFRSIYYLPAVLSGVVVIFLWKTFYGPSGMINQVLNQAVALLNLIPGVTLQSFQQDWLQNPTFALFFCLLPTVWAGMGPGCLIYLAAFKTVPEDIYEAADLDGAGIWGKLTHIALPSIKALVLINFIGAMIGAIRGAGGLALAMTGGGPYSETGGATEVVGLKLFYTTFGQLQFGIGAAMAWVLGSMLIGFTVLQLRRLSRMEFKTAEKV